MRAHLKHETFKAPPSWIPHSTRGKCHHRDVTARHSNHTTQQTYLPLANNSNSALYKQKLVGDYLEYCGRRVHLSYNKVIGKRFICPTMSLYRWVARLPCWLGAQGVSAGGAVLYRINGQLPAVRGQVWRQWGQGRPTSDAISGDNPRELRQHNCLLSGICEVRPSPAARGPSQAQLPRHSTTTFVSHMLYIWVALIKCIHLILITCYFYSLIDVRS